MRNQTFFIKIAIDKRELANYNDHSIRLEYNTRDGEV